MKMPLAKYSKLVNWDRKLYLYLFFTVFGISVGIVYGMYLPLHPMSAIKYMLLPILALFLIGIWGMPERATFLEGKLRKGFLLFFLFWCLWPPYLSLIQMPGNPWMSPQRVIIYILLVMSLIMYSVSINAKHILRENYRENRSLYLLLFTVMFFSIVSVFFSKSTGTSVTALIKDMMFNYLVFFLAATLITNEKHLKALFSISIFAALILGLMAFYESRLSQTIWSYHLPRDWFVFTEDMQRILSSRFRFGSYRVKGSSLTSLEYAELLSLVIPMCFYFIIDSRRWFLKLMMVAIITIIIYAIITSGSRLGLVGALVGMFNYSFIVALRNWRMNHASLIGPALLVLYPALMATAAFLILFSTRLSNLIIGSEAHVSSTNARADMWIKGLPLIAESPLFGHGLYMGATTLDFRTPSGQVTIDSFLLSITLEIGVIGGIAFLLLFLVGSWKASATYTCAQDEDRFGRMGAALASILLAFIIIKIVLSQRYNHTLLFMLLGVVTNYRGSGSKYPVNNKGDI